MAAARRILTVLLFGSLCFYFLLPFHLPVPGLSTVTILKLAGLLLSLSAIASMARRRYRRDLMALASRYWSFPVLALWLLVAAALRPEGRFLEAKLLAGFAAGTWVMLVIGLELSDAVLKKRAVAVLVVGGIVSALAGLVEPFYAGKLDWFWSLFRPNIGIFDPVQGKEAGIGLLHWEGWGAMRSSGIHSDPNHLANFLNIWFPLLAFLVLVRRSVSWRFRALVFVGAVVSAFTMASTLTRSAVVACGGGAVSCAALTGLIGARGRTMAIQPWLAVSLACLAGVATLVQGGKTASGVAVSGAVMLAVIGLFWASAKWARTGGKREARSQILAVCGLGLAVLVALPALSALKPPAASWRLSGIRVEEAASWRMELWKLAGRSITESPVTGIGYTGFYSRLVKGFPGFYSGVSNPHNLYLTAWITGGVIGLGLLLHFLVVLLYRAVRMLRSGIPEAGAIGVAMFWYWAGYVLLGCVGQDPFPIDEALVLGACAGLAIAPVAARGRK